MALLATRSIDPAERGAWLRLIRTRRVGPHSFWSLLDRFETAQAALAALPELSRQGGAKQPLQPFAADLAEQEYRTLRDLGGHLLVAVDGVFPPLLRQINDPPPVLSVRGNPDLLARPSVAMVGARNASTNGQRFAAALAQSLSAEGFSLTSGLARGIDAAVHHATVEDGQTVAVVAGGVDIIYPREHGELHQHLIDRAVVVAEMPLGMQPTARHFPHRNRIIAGIAVATGGVEAAKRSGSLIPARYAADFSREVCAVPGNPLDPRAAGTNQLLRDGAALVCSAQDVLDCLPPVQTLHEPKTVKPGAQPLTKLADDDVHAARDSLLKCLGPTPCSIDELFRECQVPARLGAAALVELELGGTVERTAGNLVCRLI